MNTINSRLGILSIVLICINLLFVFLGEHLLIEDSLIYEFLEGKFSYEKIAKIVDSNNKWKWLSYVLLPILLLMKNLFVAFCLTVGCVLGKIKNNFEKFFLIAISAEFIFLIPGVIKLLWFVFFETNYTLQDLQFFSPLSVISLFDPNELDPWLVYPIQLLNVFELLYWLALAWQLQEVLEMPFSESLGFVAKTYGVGLAVWVVVVMFLTVSIS